MPAIDRVPPHLYLDPIKASDAGLLFQSGEELFGRVPTRVWARTLGRFGYSGTRLYVARFSVDRYPQEATKYRGFAVKIGDKEKVASEAEPYPQVKSRLKLDYRHTKMNGVSDAALAVELFGDVSGSVTELRDVLYARRTEPSPVDLFETLYRSTLAPFHSGHSLAVPTRWGKHYRISAAERKMVRRRLDGILGSQRGGEWIHDAFTGLLQEDAALVCGPIHGDLHSSNVVLEPDGSALHLIDFANAKESGHLLKDFVLMECSVRFHRFPRGVNPETQSSFDSALLREDGEGEARTATQKSHLAPEYRRLQQIVAAIRRNAKERTLLCGCAWDFQVYKRALFATLYNMMQYDTYSLPAALAVRELAIDLSGGSSAHRRRHSRDAARRPPS